LDTFIGVGDFKLKNFETTSIKTKGNKQGIANAKITADFYLLYSVET